jgi:hypothetical protein
MVVAKGPFHVAKLVAAVEDNPTGIPAMARPILRLLAEQLRSLDERVVLLDRELALRAREDAEARRLATISRNRPDHGRQCSHGRRSDRVTLRENRALPARLSRRQSRPNLSATSQSGFRSRECRPSVSLDCSARGPHLRLQRWDTFSFFHLYGSSTSETQRAPWQTNAKASIPKPAT